MIERREFLQGSVVALSVLTLGASHKAFAAVDIKAPGIIYSNDDPGQWAGKEKLHVPSVTVAGGKVTIKTNHPMSAEHYIVRHTLVLGDGKVVGGTTFSPDSTPESSYDLPAGYKGKIYATSACNKHDLWLNEAEV